MTADELLYAIRAIADLHPELEISQLFTKLDDLMQDPYAARPGDWEDWSDKK